MEKILSILPEELGKNTNMKVDIVDTVEDTYFDFTRVFINKIKENNREGKNTVFIVPVGPVEPYPKIVRVINEERINCNNVVIINQDEWCTDDGKELIPYSSKLSFRRFMDLNFYSKIDTKLNIKKENRIFPSLQNLNLISEKITEFGGVDICFGSLGLPGHIAFNDPPEPGENISVEEYKNLGTRVVTVTHETIAENSLKYGGCLDVIPKKALTIGIKEILTSRMIHMSFMRDWQPAIVRKFIHGPITTEFPASMLQEHNNIHVVISRNAARLPLGEIPYLG
jgi:glucosamine-6-phosphate deaminase